jgi:uncharacterized alpha/beta hydrolase family protein
MKKKVLEMIVLFLLALIIYLGSILFGIYITEKEDRVPQAKTVSIHAEKQSL